MSSDACNGSNSTAKELTYTYNTKRALHMHNLLKTQIWLESFVDGLNSPTSVAFLDNENIFVLEKEG
jgi:hypothetical protein